MASVRGKSFEYIQNIIKANNDIKKSTVATVHDFLKLQGRFIEAISNLYERLGTVKDVANIFIDDEKQKVLEEFKPSEKVHLAVCGYNSAGKTSFLHEFLECGKLLPTDSGATTARIVKFSYATENEACMILYNSVIEPIEKDNGRIDLFEYFRGYSTGNKVNVKALKEEVKKHLMRPNYDVKSPEFQDWATTFVEIRIPSPILALGLEVYDTPGFLASDVPILCQNLLALVANKRPSLLFLYDNATVSDDSRKCFDQLKGTLGPHFPDIGIFFLNTKADVGTIIDDNDDDEDQQRLLQNERLKRYKLLLKVNEMSSDLSSGSGIPLEKCDCFDIYSIRQPEHEMSQIMKSNALDRIIHFTAKHDLKSTQRVSHIILTVIDAFFDFVLITNRRSPEQWSTLRDEALRWGEAYFLQFRTNIDKIIDEAKHCIPQRFKEHRVDIERRAIVNSEKQPWYKQNTALELATFPVLGAYEMTQVNVHDMFSSKIAAANKQFIRLTVENEVLKPVLSSIARATHTDVKGLVDQQAASSNFTKNELLNAAYRGIVTRTDDISILISRHGVKQVLSTIVTTLLFIPLATVFLPLAGFFVAHEHITQRSESASDAHNREKSVRHNREKSVRHYLVEMESKLSNISDQMEKSLREWLEKEKSEFAKKVHSYHQLAIETISHRCQAYELARTFASQFARIECRLVASFDLAAHDGIPPVIEQDTVGTGGCFFVHQASWGTDQSLAVKSIRDPIANKDLAYMEAHFHRTVTRLSIDHMVPLSYLYEQPDELQKLFILLPYYPKNLNSYLVGNIEKISMDKAVQISLNIARAVANMHAHDLVHRDIKVLNILLDANEQVFLADFGTCQHGTDNSTVTGSHPFAPEFTTTTSSSSDHQFSYQGSAVDVFALGRLMYVVAPKAAYVLPDAITQAHIDALDENKVPDSYRKLIIHCLAVDAKSRPPAKKVVQELEMIAKQVADTKACLVCLDQPRYARCLPCRHKTMCRTCLNNAQQADTQPKCILCREVFTSTEEDIDSHTYIGTVVSNH